MANAKTERPNIIDDDIQHRVENLMDQKRLPFSSFDDEDREELELTLAKSLQAERNHWKQKLASSMHEIDKQHKTILTTQSSLQALASDLGVVPCNDVEEDYNQWGSSTDIIKCVEEYIHKLQEIKTQPTPEPGPPPPDPKLKSAISALKKERIEHLATINSQSNQLRWLQSELNSYKYKLQKYRRIVKNYNEQSSSHFHLDDIETSRQLPNQVIEKQGGERTYTEGEQLTYPNPTDEIAAWSTKSMQKMKENGVRASPRAGINQCLRCQKLFKPGENNKLACRFHKKGREIKEQYDESGRLSRVVYKWACCRKVLDAPGCSYGFHV